MAYNLYKKYTNNVMIERVYGITFYITTLLMVDFSYYENALAIRDLYCTKLYVYLLFNTLRSGVETFPWSAQFQIEFVVARHGFLFSWNSHIVKIGEVS